MSHALVIAGIFTAYFGSMAAWLACIARTGRHHGAEQDEDLADLDIRDDEPGSMLIAA